MTLGDQLAIGNASQFRKVACSLVIGQKEDEAVSKG